ncbi:hypothetical protein DSOUD_2512 [Desulfuromonas soudanensis]|uniref:Uncharacterized protein n=1 Tax=Desulfuromonas soudanensis TaxID=1603606 RepID=A0A0M4D242_9BACT|nr:hypothetical protein [Desulfuromonas soudanensis]ALC17265.1 hypothetical protein DSOUD_2512 [Desulfuromonas soudanensis]
MSFKAFLTNRLIWFSLLVYLLTGFSSAFGAVWCLHAGQEGLPPLASLTCCPGEEGSVSHAGETDVLRERGCGPCIDLPLAPPILKSRLRTGRTLGAPSLALAPPVLFRSFPPADLRLESSPLQTPAAPSPALLHLRTVVLLN